MKHLLLILSLRINEWYWKHVTKCGECGSMDTYTDIQPANNLGRPDVLVPVRHCLKCGFDWTDWIAGDIVERAEK